MGQDDRLLSRLSFLLGVVYVKGATVTQLPPPGFENARAATARDYGVDLQGEEEVKICLGNLIFYQGRYHSVESCPQISWRRRAVAFG